MTIERLRPGGEPGPGAKAAGERRQPGPIDFSKMEDFLDDNRVEQVAVSLLRRFPVLDGSSFVTFIQPETTAPIQSPGGITVDVPVERMAVFAVISPDPRPWKTDQDGIMSAATMTERNWRALEAEKAHYVSGKEDLAYQPFLAATIEQVHKLVSASEQINNN